LNILFSSRLFYPSIGGGETNAEILAREFVSAGHEVAVITQIQGDDFDSSGIPFPFSVYRRPTIFKMIALSKWADVHFHNGVSLRDAWPLLFIRRPLVVRHLTWIAHETSPRWLSKLKFTLLYYAKNIAVSQAIADSLPVQSVVIPNPYRDGLFKRIDTIEKSKDIVFLGRLVSDKGVDTLLEALKLLKQKGLEPIVSVIGDGQEKAKLVELQHNYLLNNVSFLGKITGEALVNTLNEHKIMVIPSRWAEPFGVVALEGMACGCVPVGSEQGGLKDAIGPCGLTFKNGDSRDLYTKLLRLLQDHALMENLKNKIPLHLDQHTSEKVAKDYLAVINKVVHESNK
jgi:glycosyltransferase involved in cell wall biosynthesis